HPDKGLLLCQKALEIRPNNPIFNAAVALLSQKAGQASKAFESLELALEAWPQEAAWHAWAAHLAKEISPEKYMGHLQKAYNLNPGNVDYAFELGSAHLERADADASIDILQKATRQAPERADLWSVLANAYEKNNYLKEAFQCAETASKLAPSSAAHLLACGKLAVKMGEGDVAADYAGAAMDCAPRDEDVVVFASQVFANQGELQKSMNVIEKSLPGFEDSYKVAFEYARLKQKMEGSEKSLPIVRDLVGKYSDQPSALALLAKNEMQCGNEDEARQAAQESLKLDREQPEILLLLGQLMRQAGQLDQAIDCMSESIQLNPDYMPGYLDLGETYQQRREPMKALQTYQQAIKVAPTEPSVYYAAALVMRELKDYIGAEAMLRRAAELSPKDLNIRRQLGAVIALNLVHNSQEVNSQ
ncbi:MAG: tetratricopeptide repeat protein, partial [Anaerolineae bacterium]|nr:tetratricopeptide repeat protein [Anaerolineae bacterium]